MSDEAAHDIPLLIKTEFDETLFPEQRTSSVIKKRKKEDDNDYCHEAKSDDSCHEEPECGGARHEETAESVVVKEETKEETLIQKKKTPLKTFPELDDHLARVWGKPVTVYTISHGFTTRHSPKVTITAIEKCNICKIQITFMMSKEGYTYAKCGCGKTKRIRKTSVIWRIFDLDVNGKKKSPHNPISENINDTAHEPQEQFRPQTDPLLLERKIADLKELCRVLIVRIKAAGGPKRLCTCIDQHSGIHFEAVPFDAPVKNQFLVKTGDPDLKMIGSIPSTDFGFRCVDSIQAVENTISELMHTKEHVQKNASDDCYRCVSEDIFGRLFQIKQLLSDTHAISIIDVPRLNYELEKATKPYAHAFDSQNIYKTQHITLTNTGIQCQSGATEIEICRNTATAHCSLCKRHLCVMHISHESCFSDACNENCGCQFRRV